ncbi:MAG TPA: CHAT domain-containing tetratricopeptide repeat protein [Blastocatellia bacterium]|jgi:CHAT domain-containing protein
MSFAFRVLLYSLALSLSFNGPILALPQAPASTPNPPQSSDEETVRTLTEKYGLAITASDLEAMRQFWNPQSPNLASRLRVYQRLFSNRRIEFISSKVTRLEVTGDKAFSHLTTDERQLDKKTGAILSEHDALHGYCRSFEWIKSGAGWKIEREFYVQEELAARLEAAASDQERDEILEKEKAFVTDTLVIAVAIRGYRHRIRGDFEKSLRCIQLELAVAEKIGDQAGIAGAWVNLGLVKYAQGDYEQALPLEQKALALFEAAGNERGVATALEKLSDIYRALGDHRQAFDCQQKSLRLYEEMNNRTKMADALYRLAVIYRFQNNFQQALSYMERALVIAEELGDIIRIAILRNDIASLQKDIGNFERALEIFQDLLKQTEGFGDPSGAAMIRYQIGRVFAAQRRYDDALNYFRRALPELEAVNLKHDAANVLIDTSGLYLAQGKCTEAFPLAERAVSLSRKTGNRLTLWLALTALGYGQLGLNRLLEARQSFAEAVSIIEKLRTQTAGGDEERQRYFEGGLRAHHGLLSLLVKENQTPEALVLAERAKARVLLDALQQGRVSVQKAMTAEEQEQEGQLKSELIGLNTQLTRATQADKPDAERIGEIKSRLEKARLDCEAFQDSLYAAHPELKVNRGEASIINAEELNALLPDVTSALLEYVVTDEATYLFVVTKSQGHAAAETRCFTIPIKQTDLAKQIESFRRRLAERNLGFRAPARKLYDLLLKPAQSLLRGKSSLVIAPDDRLWELPFQALLDERDRYVIERSAVSYAPSLTVLREMRARRDKRRAEAAPSTLLALGNPLIGQETVERARLTLRDEKLHPLPEAETEVRALGRLYGSRRSKVYVGAEAREDRLKAEAGQARILHFATHGVLNNAAPLYSYLALARGDKNEDGLLEAWELMQLDLKADLAVLSACETARGRTSAGEGVIGLTWALFVAGAPTTVVSQWEVESASARDLMLGFHRQLQAPRAAGKLTKAESLRRAAIKLMKNPETNHPFYWAGFVLVGDDR